MRTAPWLAGEKVVAVTGIGARRSSRPSKSEVCKSQPGHEGDAIGPNVPPYPLQRTGDYSLSLGPHLRACASYRPSPTPPLPTCAFALCPAWLAPNASRLAQLASARDVKVA